MDESPIDNMDIRETVGHLADTTAKDYTISVISTKSIKKKLHL